ncbi:TPA: hypothetical protein EYP26_02885 [Candidatus Bathyarchaeota archaeon]|nr:hypothetical protein [Candidatus Bathyarchaeota archaeon]
MPYYCVECGGELMYDPNLRCYVCKSCGLTITFQQLIEEKERRRRGEEEAEERRRRQKEYLKWWTSKKT